MAAPDNVARAVTSPEDLSAPAAVGRYQLRERVAAGGSAVVYLGYDSGLERVVAVKLLHAHFFDSPRMLGLFQAEAKILAQLDHPAIVPVYDFGRTEDGLYYIVSKYLAGGSLKDWLAA